MIIQTIDSVSQFRDAFRDAGRKDQFTYEGLQAIYDMLEDCYSDASYELDVIAICCDFAEYTPDELMKEYSEQADVDNLEALVKYLNNHTMVLEVSGGNFIIQGF